MDENLLRFTYKNKYWLSFDLETESLNLGYAKAWQIFWMLSKGDETLEKHNYYIKWLDLNVSNGAAKVTDFNPKLIDKEGKDPNEILSLFDKYLYNPEYFIVGANIIGYDCMIHNNWRLKCNKNTNYSWLNRLYDTNCLSKAYKLNWKKKKDEDFLTFQFRLNNFRQKGLKSSVSTMAKEFNIPFNPLTLHQAQNDVPITYEIFKQLMWKLEIE